MSNEDDQVEALRRAVLAEPRNGALRFLLGAEMAQQRDYEGAILELSAAIALSPSLHVARLQLGLLHLTLAQPQHTIAVLAPLEDLDDAEPVKHFKRGLEALIADDFTSCVAALRRGMALNTTNEALNRDMNLIIERVSAAMNTDVSGAQAAGDAVRTDFSLYGLTRH